MAFHAQVSRRRVIPVAKLNRLSRCSTGNLKAEGLHPPALLSILDRLIKAHYCSEPLFFDWMLGLPF